MTVEVRQLIINSEVSSSSGKDVRGGEPLPEDVHPDQGAVRRSAWADVRGLMRSIEREQER